MRFGPRTLFEGLDWLLSPGDRIGVVGPNGSGKSTLLKILAGIHQLDEGQITIAKGTRIGYLPQDGLELSSHTVFEECLTVFDEAIALEKEQEELAEKMATTDPESAEYEAICDRFQWVIDRHTALDGYTKEAQVGAVLTGLAFPKEDWEKPCNDFSGGWQMRIALAKLLLEKPNLLLLDEPTNHLDLDARNWLESYLANYPFAFLLISHDRFFLDVTINKTVEIWNKKAHFYVGNYTKYREVRQMRIDQLKAEYKNQKDYIHHLEVFINRFRYQATKAKQVQSRVKELEKVERIELPPEEEKTIHFKFPQPEISGRVVMELKGVDKSYGPKDVLGGVNLTIERTDRIALVGVNGAGKSTLIRMLAGNESLTGGERSVGHKVTIDYFAQDQYKELDPDAEIFSDFAKASPGLNDAELRSILGCFLFSGEAVFKKIGVLSGGERNRYALAKMLLEPSNFLLLDEPTNHLDLRAKDVLLQAMMDFNGTLVFVSHDRYFIDKLATKVVHVGDGKATLYHGNYEDFLWHTGQAERAVKDRKAVALTGLDAAKSGTAEATDEPAGGSLSGDLTAALDFARTDHNGAPPEIRPKKKTKKRMNPIQADKIRAEVKEAERRIEELELEIGALQEQLTANGHNHKKSQEILQAMQSRQEDLESQEKKWEELSVQLEDA